MVRSTPAVLSLVALLFAARASAAAPEEIPFRLIDGFIAVEGRIEQSPSALTFLLDSGASESVLHSGTVHRLGVATGPAQSVRAVASEAVAHRLKGVRASSGTLDLGPVSLAADLAAADRLCSCPVDGLVGAPFFRDRVVQLDFVSRRIRVLETAASFGDSPLRLPLKLQNGIVCAAVGVNGSKPRWARLDTGCNEPLHWVVPRVRGNREIPIGSIGFVSQPEDLALVSVSLGSRTIYHTEVVLHGRELFPGESGLLGTGLLSRFRRVTVDWPHRALYLEE